MFFPLERHSFTLVGRTAEELDTQAWDDGSGVFRRRSVGGSCAADLSSTSRMKMTWSEDEGRAHVRLLLALLFMDGAVLAAEATAGRITW